MLDESHGDAENDTDRDRGDPPGPKCGDRGAEQHGINSDHPRRCRRVDPDDIQERDSGAYGFRHRGRLTGIGPPPGARRASARRASKRQEVTFSLAPRPRSAANASATALRITTSSRRRHRSGCSRRAPENGKRLTRALRELGFALSEGDERAIREGYDFVQLRNGPFPLDLIYAPLGIGSLELIGGRPVGACSSP